MSKAIPAEIADLPAVVRGRILVRLAALTARSASASSISSHISSSSSSSLSYSNDIESNSDAYRPHDDVSNASIDKARTGSLRERGKKQKKKQQASIAADSSSEDPSGHSKKVRATLSKSFTSATLKRTQPRSQLASFEPMSASADADTSFLGRKSSSFDQETDDGRARTDDDEEAVQTILKRMSSALLHGHYDRSATLACCNDLERLGKTADFIAGAQAVFQLQFMRNRSDISANARSGISIQERLDDLLADAVKTVPHEILLTLRAECMSDGPSNAVELHSVAGQTRRSPWRFDGPSAEAQHQRSIRQAHIANVSLLENFEAFWKVPIASSDSLRLAFAGDSTNDEEQLAVSHVPDTAQQARLELMSSYVPSLVLKRILSCSEAASGPASEPFKACVMFADISGFTPLTEKLGRLGLEGIERLSAAINDYFSMMIDTISSHGGDIIKFAGDAVLVVWPTDTAEILPGLVVLACQCALELVAKLSCYSVPLETNSKQSGGEQQELLLHIGIGAGPAHGVLVGGTNSRFEYFLAGNVLDQLSSCEKEASAGEVLVSSVAWLAAEYGRLSGVLADPSNSFSNYRLREVNLPALLPAPALESLIRSLHSGVEHDLRHFCQPAVLRHIESGSLRWLAELRVVSVVFVSLASPFTIEHLDDLQVVIAELQRIVFRHEGIVRQFMIDDKGSVFIAGFGCPPLSHTDDEFRAVSTALDIVDLLKKNHTPGSIGVTTGEAFVGDVGSRRRREYAMVGDVVNLSARLMMAAKKSGILIDRKTYEAVAHVAAFDFDWLAPIMVKGKSAPIPVFAPRRSAQVHAHGNTREHAHGHLHAHRRHDHSSHSIVFGRQHELELIDSLIEELQDRHGCKVHEHSASDSHLVLINESKALVKQSDDSDGCEELEFVDETGSYNHSHAQRNSEKGLPAVLVLEAMQGLGKTRMLLDMQDHLEEHDLPVLRTSGLQLESSTPYHIWFEIAAHSCLEQRDAALAPHSLSETLDDTVSSRTSRSITRQSERPMLKQAVIAAVGEDELPLLNAVLPDLKLLDSCTTSEMSSQMRAERTLNAVVTALTAAIAPGTAILVDDAHHLDSSSWAVLERLSTHLKDVLIAIAARPLKQENLAFAYIVRLARCTKIELKPLTLQASSSLIAHLLRVSVVPDDVVESVNAKAQGNPFYLERICDMIRDSGSLQVTKRCMLQTPELMDALRNVPSSVTGLVMTKIDRLDPSQQVILRLAAVMGKTFPVSILEKLLPLESNVSMDHAALLRHLAALEQMDMLELSAPDPVRAYSMSSALVGEVVYNAMLFSHRRDVHRKLAEIYEEEHPGQAQFDAVIAYHKANGELFKEAQQLYLKAGSYHLAHYAIREARDLLHSALRVLIKRGKAGSLTHISIERKLGQASLNRGFVEEARSHFEEVLKYLGIVLPQFSVADRAKSGKNMFAKKQAKLTLPNGHADTSSWAFTCDPTQFKPKELPHRKREAIIALLGLASVFFLGGKAGAMLFCASGALTLSRDQGEGEQCEALSAMILTSVDDHHCAAWLVEARSLAAKRVDLLKVLSRDSGVFYVGSSYWTRASKALEDTINFAIEVGDTKAAEFARTLTAAMYALRGDFDAAQERLIEALTSASDREDLQTRVMALNVKAWIIYMQGYEEKCFATLTQIKLPLEFVGATYVIAEINYTGISAMMSMRIGHYADAWYLTDRLQELIDQSEPTAFFAFPGYSALPEVYYLVSRNEKALAIWSKHIGPAAKIFLRLLGAVTLLTKFSERFSFARPRVEMWRGVLAEQEGKRVRADQHFSAAIDTALAQGLKYEAALVQFERGALFGRREDTDAAVELFHGLRFRYKRPKNRRDIKSNLRATSTSTPARGGNRKPRRGSNNPAGAPGWSNALGVDVGSSTKTLTKKEKKKSREQSAESVKVSASDSTTESTDDGQAQSTSSFRPLRSFSSERDAKY